MTQDQIIKSIDNAISELVYEKTGLMKAYNYYNCKMDAEQFRHLEENYGIGTPTQIEFIPLVRKHIDALVGEYTSIPTKPKISCKDENTLSNILRDKQLKIKSEIFLFYKTRLENKIFELFQVNQLQLQLQLQQASDPLIAKELEKLVKDLDLNFVSEYELAALNIIQYIMQARNIDFETKKTLLAKDLYISGTAYYKVYKTKGEEDFNFEVLNPIHTFIDRNPNSIYLKDSYRSVVRRYMNKIEILAKYGKQMNQDAISEVKKLEQGYLTSGNTYYVRSQDLEGNPDTSGILAGLEIQPGLPSGTHATDNRINSRLIEVMEVEWLDVEKEDGEFVTYRYEGVRINGNIYIPIGKVENCSRSISDPTATSLTVNGLFFSDRNGLPFSLVMATANLLDKYNILHFYRDNLISSSGTKGDWVDVSMLPTFLGDDLTERIQKFVAYKKQMGLALIDTSQEGKQFNTVFNGYDDTLQAGLMQAFDYAIQSIENTCSSITGVSRERLANGIEQRDAVSNVEVGVKMSAIVTRQYSQTLDTLIKEVLTDCINTAKIVWKKGLKGTITLGDSLKRIFTALPEHYTTTDFDIHVNDSSELLKDIETIKLFTLSLIESGLVTPDVAVDAIDAKSLTELKTSVKLSIKQLQEEQGLIALLTQLLEQSQQLLQLLQQQLQQAQQSQLQLDMQKLQFEALEAEKDREIEWYKARTDKQYKEDTIEAKEKLLEAEIIELNDGNSKNNEIKNVI